MSNLEEAKYQQTIEALRAQLAAAKLPERYEVVAWGVLAEYPDKKCLQFPVFSDRNSAIKLLYTNYQNDCDHSVVPLYALLSHPNPQPPENEK